jgi:hypothetical protein
VVVWEGGVGHRVEYPNEAVATNAALWLQLKARQIVNNKATRGVATAEVYSEDMTSYQMVRRYLKTCRKFGHRVLEEALTRPVKEFW